jgi:hypothetical protein
MNKLFIESTGFTSWVIKFLDDQEYSAFQQQLIADPGAGEAMPGCGGLRKIRLGLPGRGNRSGARVIYLHVEEAGWIFLLHAYGKGEKEDLRPQEKKVLQRLARQLKAEAGRAAGRSGKEKGT